MRKTPTGVRLQSFEGWFPLDRIVGEFRAEIAKLLQRPASAHEDADLRSASDEVLSWLAGGDVASRVKDRFGRDARAVPSGYWETPMAPRTLINGSVQIGAVIGIAMVPAAIIDLIDQYLDNLRRSPWRHTALPVGDVSAPLAAPPLADFADMRNETDPARRQAREAEMEEYRRLIAQGKISAPEEPPSVLAEARARLRAASTLKHHSDERENALRGPGEQTDGSATNMSDWTPRSRRGRKQGSGAFDDTALLLKMLSLLAAGNAPSSFAAARQVVADLSVSHSPESAQRRLSRKFNKHYGSTPPSGKTWTDVERELNSNSGFE
jgi:hypothetical protein